MELPVHKQNAVKPLKKVITDIHFWIPLAVLIGGLLLLNFIH